MHGIIITLVNFRNSDRPTDTCMIDLLLPINFIILVLTGHLFPIGNPSQRMTELCMSKLYLVPVFQTIAQ